MMTDKSTIKIEQDVHHKLVEMKAVMGLKTISDVVKWLMENKK